MSNETDGHDPKSERSPNEPTWWVRFISGVERSFHERRAKRKNESAPDKAARRTANATISMAVFTVVIAGVGFFQWRVLSDTLTEMKASFAADRAYILYDNKFDAEPIKPGAVASTLVKNFGRTPGINRIPPEARYKYFQNGFQPLEWKATDPSLVDADGLMPPTFIFPVDATFGPVGAHLEATDKQIDAAKHKTGKIIFQVLIGYDDVRDGFHKTAMCWFYDFSVKGFYLCPEKGANYHT